MAEIKPLEDLTAIEALQILHNQVEQAAFNGNSRDYLRGCTRIVSAELHATAATTQMDSAGNPEESPAP